MYRAYENPWKLEDRLEEARERLKAAVEAGDEDEMIFAAEEVNDLEERVNFAWQDDEECSGMTYEDIMWMEKYAWG